MNLISPTIQSLERALSTSALKQQTHTANIANVDTPGYKSKQVNFEAVMKNAVDKQALASYKTDPRHISFGNEAFDPRVTVNDNTEYKINGNNVDMDVEMAELAKNQLLYNAVTDRISGKFRSLSSVINGGR